MKTLDELGISPAPWKVCDEYIDFVDDAKGLPVMTDCGYVVTQGKKVNADAQLIAAAPELYECLSEAVECIEINCRTCKRNCKMKMSFEDATIHNCERILEWRAAIAKAAGEEAK